MSTYLNILKKYWGFSAFRPLQEDIIKSVGDEQKDTLGLLPTGGGKSVIFQIPALAQEGVCIVITPLIALMKDQVYNLNRRKIRAAAIHSGLTRHEIELILDNSAHDYYKFLYISPERLNSEMFRQRIQAINVNLIAVDEAHCISQWGYDFRPSYLKISEIREILPNNPPFLALTATATPDVVEDIQEKLDFAESNVFRKTFERKNLIYIVRYVEDKNKYLLKIVRTLQSCGIIYVRSRKKTREIAEFLMKNSISADFYHAGLSSDQREQKQKSWQAGNTLVIVATNAFGMGIDKPDVRFVLHAGLPDSLEAYFQEAGRAGRDEKKAYGVLLYNKSDRRKLEKSVETSFPERKTIKQVYEALGNYFQIPIGAGAGRSLEFKIGDFISVYKFNMLTVYNSLKILQRGGYLEVTDEIHNPSRVFFKVNRDDLYKFQVKNENFDNFIKLLLRSYPGLFTEYRKIDEDALARKSGTNRDTIYQYLLQLSKLKIINYIPRKRTPLIIFTTERLPLKSVFLSKQMYLDRKNHYKSKVDAVIRYAENDKECRSKQLLRYFGEKEAQACGKCDVCVAIKEQNPSEQEFQEIKDFIISRLTSENLTVTNLLDEFNSDKEKKALKVIHWLQDHNYIYQDEFTNLALIKENTE